jgi:hypothetical protein
VRQQPGTIIPLLGATKLTQLQDNLDCLHNTLTTEQLAQLSAANPLDLGFPHDFLASEMVRQLVFGGTYERIDRPRLV